MDIFMGSKLFSHFDRKILNEIPFLSLRTCQVAFSAASFICVIAAADQIHHEEFHLADAKRKLIIWAVILAVEILLSLSGIVLWIIGKYGSKDEDTWSVIGCVYHLFQSHIILFAFVLGCHDVFLYNTAPLTYPHIKHFTFNESCHGGKKGIECHVIGLNETDFIANSSTEGYSFRNMSLLLQKKMNLSETMNYAGFDPRIQPDCYGVTIAATVLSLIAALVFLGSAFFPGPHPGIPKVWKVSPSKITVRTNKDPDGVTISDGQVDGSEIKSGGESTELSGSTQLTDQSQVKSASSV